MTDTEQRETEIVSGRIKGVIVKGPSKWQIEVQPEGSQYTRKLWTKDAELVEAISKTKIGEFGGFVCSASYWTNNDGKQVRSLWIDGEGDGDGSEPARSVATPAPAAQTGGIPADMKQAMALPMRNDVMSKEEWARKDSAIHKMACIKTAADALKHTMPAQPSGDDLLTFINRVKFLSHEWHTQVEAVRAGDDSDLPFLSQADIDEIPY